MACPIKDVEMRNALIGSSKVRSIGIVFELVFTRRRKCK
jgi:hypothetical protein